MTDAETLRKPLGTTSRENLSLTTQQMQSLRRIIAQYLPDEQRHWEESGEPAEHVYYDLIDVRWALREHDNNMRHGGEHDGKLDENITRLSQG